MRHGNQQHLLLKQQHKVQAVEAEKRSKITKFSAPRPTRTQDETFIPDLNDAFILQEDAQEVLVSQSAPAPNEEM